MITITRCSRDPRDALYQLKYWPIYCGRPTNCRNKSQIACQPEEHFQKLPRFITLPAKFCTCIAGPPVGFRDKVLGQGQGTKPSEAKNNIKTI